MPTHKSVQAGPRRGYKQTEIGEIPVEWDVKRLEEISRCVRERVGDKKLVTMSISAGIGFVPQSEKFGRDISGSQYTLYTVLRQGQFAYNKGNSKSFPEGCIYLLYDNNEIAVPNVFICFELNQKFCFNHYFQQLFLNNAHGRELKVHINSGTRNNGLLNLTPRNFFSIRLPLPPLPEQKQIAAILSSVDDAIRSTQAVIDQARTLKKGLLGQLLTRGIGHKKFKQTEIGEIPVEWEVSMLFELIQNLAAGKSVNSENRPIVDNEIGVLKTGCVSDGVFFPSEHKAVLPEEVSLVKISPKRNSLILSRMNTPELVGEVGFVDQDYPSLFIPDRLWLVLPAKNVNSKWLCYALVCWRSELQNIATGTSGSMKNISQEKLSKILLPVPPLSEQKTIAEILSGVDAVIRQNSDQVEQLKRTKAGLMQDLLTGRKRVAV